MGTKPMSQTRIPFPAPRLYSCELTVRYGDLSTAGHLAADRLVGYLNEVRYRFFRERGLHRTAQGGIGVVFADLAVTFAAEAFAGEVLRIDMTAGNFRAKGCDLFFRITATSTETQIAAAQVGIVFFDYARRAAVSVPKAFLAAVDGESIP